MTTGHLAVRIVSGNLQHLQQTPADVDVTMKCKQMSKPVLVEENTRFPDLYARQSSL